MCGFVCLYNIGDEALAASMIEKISHRGPDAVEVIRGQGAPVVMAHCRLSIIGPEDGKQPIYQDRDLLVANGEIYNHADLRAILGESAFETESDSEAILHLFRDGDLRWIARLDGMFAFVLATKTRIIAARDPLGIKPLYLARIGDGMAFASELKAFDGLALDSVEAIEPGCLFDSIDGMRRWYRTPHGAAEPEEGLDVEATARELRLVLEEAVSKWMVADVEVGSFLSGGLDSLRLSERLQRSQEATVIALADLAEHKDTDTGDHVLRVGTLTERVARHLRDMGTHHIDEDYITRLGKAAILHDVGKVAIADAILRKPGRLDAEEWETMKTHTTQGASILSRADALVEGPTYLGLAAKVAETHHERWDGGGYPHMLSGETIPLAGRITAVVDVFDALTTDRPYKKAWPREDALDLVRGERGGHFDPAIADAFLTVVMAQEEEEGEAG